MPKCECEHDKHFDDTLAIGDAHLYNAECNEVFTVKTPYGTYHICLACKKTCLLNYAYKSMEK